MKLDFSEEYKKLADEIIRVQYPYLEQMHYTVRDRADRSRNEIADKIKHFVDSIWKKMANAKLSKTIL